MDASPLGPRDPENAEKAASLAGEASADEATPWWVGPVQFFAGVPILAAAFLIWIMWKGRMDG